MQELTKEDFETLNPGRCLNDKIINSYMKILEERSRDGKRYKKTMAFDSYFFQRWDRNGEGYEGVKTWVKKDPFTHEFLLFPIHDPPTTTSTSGHWSLIIARPKQKDIVSFDSLGRQHPDRLEQVKEFLTKEAVRRKVNKKEWTVSESFSQCPRQQNKFDCGVYTCLYAETLTSEKSWKVLREKTPHELREDVMRKLQWTPIAKPISKILPGKKNPPNRVKQANTVTKAKIRPIPLDTTKRLPTVPSTVTSGYISSNREGYYKNEGDAVETVHATQFLQVMLQEPAAGTTPHDPLLIEMNDFIESPPEDSPFTNPPSKTPTEVKAFQNLSISTTITTAADVDMTEAKASTVKVNTSVSNVYISPTPPKTRKRGKTQRKRIFLEDGTFIRKNQKKIADYARMSLENPDLFRVLTKKS